MHAKPRTPDDVRYVRRGRVRTAKLYQRLDVSHRQRLRRFVDRRHHPKASVRQRGDDDKPAGEKKSDTSSRPTGQSIRTSASTNEAYSAPSN